MRDEPVLYILGGEKPVVARHIHDWSDDVAERESELEAAYAKQLTRGGKNVERQGRIGGVGIADIVTDNAVIEVKLWLTRSALFSAVGQVTTYAAVLGKPRRVVMGYESTASTGLVQAIQAAGVDVVSWIAVGGPGYIDYTQADDYEGPEDVSEEGDDGRNDEEAW